MNSVFSHSRLAGSFACLLSILLAVSTQAGQFDEIRSEVRQDKPEKPKKSKKHHHHHDDHDDDDDSILGSILGGVISGIFNAAVNGSDDSTTVVEHHYYDASCDHLEPYPGVERLPSSGPYPAPPVHEEFIPGSYFAEFPYAHGIDGYMLTWENLGAAHQQYSTRVQFEYGSDFDAIDRWSAGILHEGPRGFGIDSQWNYYTENLGPGVQDNLHVGDVNLMFRAIELEHMLWRIGAGINWFDSRSMSDAGLNATVKVDYFPVQPIILSGEVDYGRVGDAEMFHGSVSVGVILNRFEVFSGYDYRKIGPIKLEGPLFGLRVWW